MNRDLTNKERVLERLGLENDSIEKTAEYFCENECINDWFGCCCAKCTDDGQYCLECWNHKVKEISESEAEQ